MATFIVNDPADAIDTNPGNGSVDTAGGIIALRAAVMEANALAGADVIVLPAGTFAFDVALGAGGEDAAATGDLDITSDITIRGQGIGTTTIDAQMLDAVFNVLGTGTLTLENLTITNGMATGDNNTYTENTPPSQIAPLAPMVRPATSIRGNGISVQPNGTLNVTNAEISGNIVTDDDAAAIFNYNGTVTLSNTTISGHNGAAIGAELIRNRAGGGGTATFSVLNNSTISGNTIGGNNQSRLIYNDGDNGTINMTFRDSTISGNATTGTTGKFLYSKSRGGGTGNLTIDNTNILNNSTSGNRNSFFLQFNASATTGTFQLTNSTVSGNGTLGNGIPGGNSFFYIRAQNDGGAVNSTISGTTFANNSVNGSYSDFLVHIASGATGGLATTLSSTITDSTFTNNTSNGNYSDGFSNQTFGGDAEAVVTFSGVTISGNSAGANLFVNQARSPIETLTVNITDTVIANNSVNAFGAGGSTFNANPNAPTPGTLNLNLTNSTVSGNSGGNSPTFDITNTGFQNLNLANSTISGNTTTGNGGAIESVAGATITVNNSTITGNTANRGGGIYATGGTVNVNNSIIAGNTATTANPDVSGTFVSNGANIIGDATGGTGFGGDTTGVAANAVINTTLANNGGPTPTHALVAGSVAIDGGNNANIPLDTQDLN